MKKILVTGGAGFVGSCLAIKLKEQHDNVQVIAMDNLKRRGSELNLPRLRKFGVDFVHGDIRNLDDMLSIGEVNTILECSAEPSVLAGYGESPSYLLQTNLCGTINCLEVARRYKSDFVFLSTSRVYPIKTINELKYTTAETRFELKTEQEFIGVTKDGFNERFPLDGIRSLYGATKLCSEYLIQEYTTMYGIRSVINRCGVLTGPWQMGKVDQGVIVLWVARHFFGEALTYLGYGGNGKQVRDILHVDDLYRLIDLELSNMGEHNGTIYNVGGGNRVSVSLKELTEMCQKVVGRCVPISSIAKNRIADIPYYISDCSKVFEKTGWGPKITTEEIIQEIFSWINDNKKELKPILLG
jgi:CDP-paratose 2-epimerase